MNCPECESTLSVRHEYKNPEFVCVDCGEFLPRGAD
jgi:transcription initiation factor TFIIIB Brf1 subunit/transcription initiation factor TFIIB